MSILNSIRRSGPVGLFSMVILALALAASVNASAAEPYQVSYTLTFDVTWSETTHPLNFPPNPHWSGLIGGTHNDQVDFWEVGQLASTGIQWMAEFGSQSPLDDEVDAAITAGNADQVIAGAVLWNSPGTVSVTFTASQDFPLLTLVSMIAPSPDWFVGVAGLDLFPGGSWVDEIEVDLWPYDAGTDSGANYTSGNQPTNPHVPIFLKTDGPFAGGVQLGTFTITRDLLSDIPTSGDFAVSGYPNPFNPRITFDYFLPAAGRLLVEVYDLRGQLLLNLLDEEKPQGNGAVSWDGTDRLGRAVPAETYLMRARSAQYSAVEKITLAK